MTTSPPTPVAPGGGLKRALLFSSGGTAAARLTGAFGGLLAARLLGPSGRGQLAILVFLATAASMAAAAGVQFWTAREVARSGGTRVVAWVVRAHAVVMVAVIVLVGVLAAGAIGSLADVGWTALWLTVGVAVTNALQLVILAMPDGLRSMGIVAVALIVAGSVYVVGGQPARGSPGARRAIPLVGARRRHRREPALGAVRARADGPCPPGSRTGAPGMDRVPRGLPLGTSRRRR